jgi:hypothetical protein
MYRRAAVHKGQRRYAAWPFVLVLLIAGATRWLVPFDGLYGQDAFAYFRFARALGPHLLHGVQLPPLYWPRGYPIVTAMLLPLAGGGPLAGQLVSALACAWTATATFLIVRQLRPQPSHETAPVAPLVAGLCVAASGGVLRSSQVVMADALSMALATTAIWCAVQFTRNGRGPWLVACGAAVAAGAVTRWQIALLALPIAAFFWVESKAAAHEGAPTRAIARGWWIIAVLTSLAIVVPQLVAARAAPLSLEHHEWFERWSLLNAGHRDFHTREGHAQYRLPVGLFYLVRLGWPDYMFPSVAALAFAGAWLVLVRERRIGQAALLLGWPVASWILISGIPYENPRFLLPTLPALGALAGIGFGGLWDGLSVGRRPVLALLLAASLAVGIAFGVHEHRRVVARKNADVDLVRWAAEHVPSNATLLMSGGTLVFEEYGSTKVRDTFLLTRPELDAVLARDCPCFYLEDPVEIAHAWAGLPAEARFEALRRGPGLTAVATHPPYTLFRIGTR